MCVRALRSNIRLCAVYSQKACVAEGPGQVHNHTPASNSDYFWKLLRCLDKGREKSLLADFHTPSMKFCKRKRRCCLFRTISMHGHTLKVHIILTQHAPGGGMQGGRRREKEGKRLVMQGRDACKTGLYRNQDCKRGKKAQISLMKEVPKWSNKIKGS